MFIVELLHNYAPDAERQAKAKVAVGAEHLSYAERQDVEKVMVALVTEGNRAMAFSMQHVGPLGDALDLACTIACAGETLCSFALNRPLINPHELAAAKTGIAESWLAVDGLMSSLDLSDKPDRERNATVANEFLNWAPERFVPLFEDLEAHAQKRFPHLAANNPKEGEHV